MIEDWIDSAQRSDLHSNEIEPFPSVGKLPHGFGRQATGLARGLHVARTGFVLRRFETRFCRFRGANFLCVQALSGAYGLGFHPLGVGFLGCFLRRRVDLGARQGLPGTLDIGQPQTGETKQASRQGRERTIAFDRSSPATCGGCLDPIETCEADCSRPCFRP